MTACPSGVAYGELVTGFRAHAHERDGRTPGDRLLRTLMLRTLPYPGRFRLALRLGGAARLVASLLPARLGALLDLVPHSIEQQQALPDHYPAQGPRRARVALLAGCVQQALAPGIEGSWDDSVAHMTPWGFDVVQMSIPVLLLHGGRDRAVPFSHGQWLAAHIPGVETWFFEEEGHGLPENHIGDVHAWLLDHSS